MELPLTERELETIITTLRTVNPTLHNKLWSYKMNTLKGEKKDGLS
jgi:hypothetical protein